MTLKVLNSKVSEIEEDRNILLKNMVVSDNGIVYKDPRPLRYCTLYQTIIAPILDQCRTCASGKDVSELKDENKEMFLDSQGRVNDIDTGGNVQVTAYLLIAKLKNGEEGVVKRLHGNIKQCPKYA